MNNSLRLLPACIVLCASHVYANLCDSVKDTTTTAERGRTLTSTGSCSRTPRARFSRQLIEMIFAIEGTPALFKTNNI